MVYKLVDPLTTFAAAIPLAARGCMTTGCSQPSGHIHDTMLMSVTVILPTSYIFLVTDVFDPTEVFDRWHADCHFKRHQALSFKLSAGLTNNGGS